MKRDLLKQLMHWKTHPLRVPLILRGARQVGKSYLVREFGKTFDDYLEINFEKEKKTHIFFEGDLNIPKILEDLALHKGQKITIGKTLLFFDEIQECQNALRSLRYFKEECPDLHVIAAGSLIDFALQDLGMPVGRVQFQYLHPMSFGEFLIALGREDLRIALFEQKVHDAIHSMLLDYLKTYLWLGGMPEVIDSWLRFKDPNLSQEVQDRIILSYKDDFPKYAKTHQVEYLDTLFAALPNQIGQKFKYSAIDTMIKQYALKNALSLLIKAGIAKPAYHSSGQTYPLGTEKDERKFKIFFLDIGLAQRILGLNLKEWVVSPLNMKLLGPMAEQFVAQEYIAYTSITAPPALYYWHREAKNSNAEVDFLCTKSNAIIPVEVKSGIKGGMKSLKVFLDTHPKSPYGLKISEGNFATQTRMIEIPFYSIEAWLKTNDENNAKLHDDNK